MPLPSPLPLAKPPIVEAILDIQVAFPHAIDVSQLRELGRALRPEYPQFREQFQATVNLEQVPTTQTINRGLRGYSFLSTDLKKIVQVRIDGFTFNRLAPYVSWEDAYSQALAAWGHYRSAFPDFKVTRVATRFLNRILLPLDDRNMVEIDDYFKIGTKDPHDDTLVFASFFSNQFFNDVQTGFGANLNTASQPVEGRNLPVILDIEVFEQRLEEVASTEPFSILNKMREVKNRLFLRSLTAKALELFK